MFNLGLFEMTLFGVIALVVLGPDKLLQGARALGKWYAIFKNTKDRLQNDIANELHLLETQAEIKKELAKLRDAEAEIQAQMHELQRAVEQNRKELLENSSTNTKPLAGQFFLLGEYDKNRRQPRAPFLPNYTADPLLSSTAHTTP